MHSFVTLSLFKIGWLESSQDLIFMFEIQTTLTKIGQNFGKQKLSLAVFYHSAQTEQNKSIKVLFPELKPNRTELLKSA